MCPYIRRQCLQGHSWKHPSPFETEIKFFMSYLYVNSWNLMWNSAQQALLEWAWYHMHRNGADSLTSFVTDYLIVKVLTLILTFQDVIRFFKPFLHISLNNLLYRLKKGLVLNSFLGNNDTMTFLWKHTESKASFDWSRNI